MRHVLIAVCCAAWSAPLTAQEWVPPQPPCNISPGFFRINSAVVNLKNAAEKPAQRDHLLRQTLDVLTRSIRDDKQEGNPAAWYYLGRYFVEVADPIGADTAFAKAETLAPQCKDDIRGYRERLGGDVLTAGLSAWQAGHEDSAAVLLGQAYRVNPANPKPLFQLGALYGGRNQNDSAAAYLRKAIQASAGDTAYDDARREALASLGRLALQKAQADPAAGRWPRTRYTRDSLGIAIANDSVVLGRVYASAASRRQRGARLAPADQAAFTRDSSAREESLKRGRDARGALAGQIAADSAAISAAYSPAFQAYEEFTHAYPTDVDAATRLAALYAQTGRTADAAGAFDALFRVADRVPADELADLGSRLVQGGLPGPGLHAFDLALKNNPYNRRALFELATAALARKDTATAVATAQRLVAIDPLNRSALHLAAQGWELRGSADSARTYSARADTGLAVDVTVASFVMDRGSGTLTGIATNLRQAGTGGFQLIFEFLDRAGGVKATQPVDIPALGAGASSQFQAKVSGEAIVGWRYRRP